MVVIAADWSSPQAEPVSSLIAACPEHLIGAILIPGAYGLKARGKRYPEYWQWPVFQEGAPAAFLTLLQNGDYPPEAFGFHEQLWCGVWAPPDRPYDVTFLCAQLQHESLQQVVEAMIPTPARLYASPFDLYELLDELGLGAHHSLHPDDGGWLSPLAINHDRLSLERVFQRLLLVDARAMFIRHLRRLPSAVPGAT